MLFEIPNGKGQKFKNSKLQSSSSSPTRKELVFKVASNIKHSSANIAIQYITRGGEKHGEDKFISPENEQGDKLTREESRLLSRDWSDEFKKDTRINSRKMTHFILSIDVNKNSKTTRDFENATREYLKERFGDDGFRYVFVIHNDTNKPHAHILVNNFNLETGKKLAIDKEWLMESRLIAKRHLDNHNLKQDATSKKDRIAISLSKTDLEKDYSKIKNWFNSKLLTNAKNPSHAVELQKQWLILNELKASIDKEAKHTSQKKMELKHKIKLLKRDLFLEKRFSSRAEANYELAKMIKEVDPKRSLIDRALHRHAKLTERQKQSQIYAYQNHAKELIKIEKLVSSSTTMNRDDKKEILSQVKSRKKELEHRGVDFKKMASTEKKQAKYSDAITVKMIALDKDSKSLDREFKRNGAATTLNATKRLERTFDIALSRLDESKFTSADRVVLTKKLDELIVKYKNHGIDAKSIHDNWQEKYALKNKVGRFAYSASIDNSTLDSAKLEQLQKNILVLKQEIAKSSLNQKEKITATKSLDNIQTKKIDVAKNNDFHKLNKEINAQLKSLTTLDKKRGSDDKSATRQAYAMTKTLLLLESNVKNAPNLLVEQKTMLSGKINQLHSELVNRGADIEAYRKKQTFTEQVKLEHQKILEVSMERSRLLGYNQASKAIEKNKLDIQSIDVTRDEKRELRKSLSEKETQLNISRDNNTKKLIADVDKLKKTVKAIDDHQLALKDASLSPLERLNVRRSTENLYTQLNELTKQIKPMLNVPTDTNLSKNIRQFLSTVERSYSKSRTINRS
jgi:hypothetical protein